MIRAGIVGGTGYTGVELLRLLAGHGEVQVTAITSRTEAGVPVVQMFPSLRGRFDDLHFCTPQEAALEECDVVFFATPNGVAMHQAEALLAAGVKVVDFSADFRLKDADEWAKWYGMEHAAPHLLGEAVYGLPELKREAIRSARLVANPGCYPTATQLGFAPLLRAGVVAVDSLISSAASGVSGAGRKAQVHALLTEAGDSFSAYGVAGHRHLPEIRQELSQYCGEQVGLTFVPHLAPMIRGIHATLYARLTKEADLQALFEAHYASEPFVDVMPAGSHPQTRTVRAANLCRLAVFRPQEGDTVVVLSVIDNLMKGAAGQAVQNMNLMFGLKETMGLEAAPVCP